MNSSAGLPDLATVVSKELPDVAQAAWTPLPSWSGRAWLVDSAERCVVVKQASASEVVATKLAASAGIAPRVLGSGNFSDHLHWLALEYVMGEHVSTLELRRPATLDEIAHLLGRWHHVPVHELDPPRTKLSEVRRAAVRELTSRELPLPSRHLRNAADDLEKRLTREASADVMAHLDIAANVLRVDDRLLLVDFEYVSWAPPERELGQLAWESELREDETERLVEVYLQTLVSPAFPATRVAAWAYVTAVTWLLWGACRPGMELWTTRTEERLESYWWDASSLAD